MGQTRPAGNQAGPLTPHAALRPRTKVFIFFPAEENDEDDDDDLKVT